MNNFFPVRSMKLAETRLIPEVLIALLWARYAVSFRSAKSYLPAKAPAAALEIPPRSMDYAAMVAGVVEGVSRRLPWPSTCLIKALAGSRILTRKGIPVVIHLGIELQLSSRKMGAHAWLSLGDVVLLGGSNLDHYREIARLGDPVKFQ